MPKEYADEVRERAVGVVPARLNEYPSLYAACQALAPMLNVGVETVRKWVIQAKVDAGTRTGPTSVELEEIKQLEKENRDLNEINEVLKAACRMERRANRLPGTGGELDQYVELKQETGTAVCFASAHSPWQRPLNENTNRLLECSPRPPTSQSTLPRTPTGSPRNSTTDRANACNSRDRSKQSTNPCCNNHVNSPCVYPFSAPDDSPAT